ncbi:hypothetical protein HT578_03810 [Novosphingobium decolorationis]|uniref:DUF927 domain-containing protein n=1 Tax=Novosphingobium decolorationis TaxID=2698673 RepID=A0ABX8E1X2_9SPHN|nr:hypothetical protein HT578_03810 [Novosphingobium decolorationis]
MSSNPIEEALANPQPAPDFAQPGDIGPETGRSGEDDYDRFPPGCPITPLGNMQDLTGKQTCFYLNYNGQLVGLEAGNRHGKNGLIALFGPKLGWLEANFGQYSKPVREQIAGKGWVEVEPSRLIGFDQAKSAQALIVECVRKGVFDPAGRLRGRGAHRPEKGAGGLVLHCGDKILASVPRVDGTLKGWRWADTGLHERYVYQSAEPIPRPWHEEIDARPAEKLLALLQTWNWKRPLLDPILCLGAIGAGMIGGALPWRPHVWITGGAGTGKSTLNGKDGLVHRLFGNGVFRTSDTTAAGIRSSLKNSTVPVMIDELEAAKDSRHTDAIVGLARIASSGDTASRGSSDHGAVEFTLQSSFWFSSIIIPPMEPQDRSRLAILELGPIPQGAKEPEALRTTDFGVMGRQLLRRMIDGWPRLVATKAKFHAQLAELGHVSRACDQFGTLLACADVLISDDVHAVPSDEDIAHWVAECRPQRMAEIAESDPDHVACIKYMLTSLQQARGGDEREQIGTWIWRAVEHSCETLMPGETENDQARRANERLSQIGLKIVRAERKPPAGKSPARWGVGPFDQSVPGWLAVANSHRGLDKVFEDSNWRSAGWKQSLARVPGAETGVDMKFGHVKSRAVLVPLCEVFDEADLPKACAAEAVTSWVAEQKREVG